MTEGTVPAPAAESDEPRPARPLNVTALTKEALAKSGVLWIEVPGDRAWPVWHTVLDDHVLVVSGPGEQHLPWLPETVRLILRSKDSGGRLLTVTARVREIAATDEDWAGAAAALRAERLNAPDDVTDRWAREGTIRALQPFGPAVQGPGMAASGDSGRVLVHPGPATTAGWRPWHLGGRPQRRKRQRPSS